MQLRKKLQFIKRISKRPLSDDTDTDEFKAPRVTYEEVEPIISNTEILHTILDWFKGHIEWKALVNRNFSIFIYTLLKEAGLGTLEINNLLKIIGGVRSDALQIYFCYYQSDDFSSLNEDGRAYTGDVFWDRYPEIEIDAKIFATGKAREKTSDLTGKLI